MNNIFLKIYKYNNMAEKSNRDLIIEINNKLNEMNNNFRKIGYEVSNIKNILNNVSLEKILGNDEPEKLPVPDIEHKESDGWWAWR